MLFEGKGRESNWPHGVAGRGKRGGGRGGQNDPIRREGYREIGWDGVSGSLFFLFCGGFSFPFLCRVVVR